METAITLSMLIMALLLSIVLALAVEEFLFEGFLHVVCSRFDRVISRGNGWSSSHNVFGRRRRGQMQKHQLTQTKTPKGSSLQNRG